MKTKAMPRLTSFVLALSMLLSLAACGGGTSAATMHLRKTEGTVAVSDGEGKDIAPKDNLGLYSGYQVGTQAESYAWIDLDKVKLTKMDANSEIEVIKEDKRLEINVKSGSLFFNVTEPLADDESLNIRTSSMAVGIRGTCGWVAENAAALLEGTVEVTAGDQTVTVSAGEMAVLTDGVLEVKPFTAASVPAFVREEIAEDKELAETIQDTTGMDLTGADPLADYEELLSTLENVLYSEVIDFEKDGSPELLVFYESRNSYDVPSLKYCFYQNGSNEPVCLDSNGYFGYTSCTSLRASLVESNGRLYLHIEAIEDSTSLHIESDYYYGSVAQENGGMEDWRLMDGSVARAWNGGDFSDVRIYARQGDMPEGGERFTDYAEVEAIRTSYTHVRDLLIYDGTNVTVAEP